MAELAAKYVTEAREYTTNKCYNKAFDFYFRAFKKNPDLKHQCEEEVLTVLRKLNEILAHDDRMEDVFANFNKAVKAFPNNFTLLNDIGKYLYKCSFFIEAWSHFQKALKVDPGYVCAEKNLNSVKNILVERWHFRMLNDRIRNELYRTAIHESITSSQDRVIDIGTGTGLLALFAHECKPAVITACDSSETMAKMAEANFKDLGINDIKVINKMANNTIYTDLGGKATLLITELFDAGLFGEHALSIISHAQYLILSDFGRVLPCRAEFFICAVSCNELNLKYQLSVTAKTMLNLSDIYVHISANHETYDCEDLNSFKDLKYMTNPTSLLKIDFNNYDDILDKLYKHEPYTIELEAVEDGEADVLVGWFNLHLTENVTLTTDPRSPMRCNAWQQPVFFDFTPRMLKKTDTITSHFLTNCSKLTMLEDSTKYIHRISPATLRFLNDAEYMKMIMGCTGMACIYLSQIVEMSEIKIIDLSPFPLFGLQMLKRGAKTLVCLARTYNDEAFINQVAIAYNINLSQLTVIESCTSTEEDFRDKYHAIFCNPFELCGEIAMNYRKLANTLKNSHLLPGGLFMPYRISVMGQLVDCPWIDINNRVNDENVCNYNISKYMNMYQVSQNLWLNISHLEYDSLSEPICLGIYDNSFRDDVLDLPVTNDGHANALLCWYKIELMEGLGEVSTNRSNSLIYNMAYLAYPKVIMEKESIANVLRCVDPDGSFKFLIDDDELA